MKIEITKRKQNWIASWINEDPQDDTKENDTVFANSFSELLKNIGEKQWIDELNKNE